MADCRSAITEHSRRIALREATTLFYRKLYREHLAGDQELQSFPIWPIS